MKNRKQKDFLISNTIVVGFTLLLVLIVESFFKTQFQIQEQYYPLVTIFLLIVGAVLYIFLSQQLLDGLFHSEAMIENQIKETLHELNTPVATIQINSKILQKKQSDKKNIQRLQRIDSACEDLLELYNQMEYTIKDQIDKVITEKFQIDDLIKKSIQKHNDIKQNITINYTNIDLVIKADKNGFVKVIDNLISNGIKYNKDGGSIDIYYENHILYIKDSGIGIDTKNLFLVFDRYYQENNNKSGVGLGLNMVKTYCDRYKIDIKIDSKLNSGTTIGLDLKNVESKI